MTAQTISSSLASAAHFADAARRFWFSVFPAIHAETRIWRKRAEAIPDPELRRLAIEAQHTKRGNVEGSAAFAAFAPAATRRSVIRAQVAFQSAYDYIDTLAEQPHPDATRNAQHLHQALTAAVERDGEQPDYYAYHPRRDDSGYLAEIVTHCRTGLRELPSREAITKPAEAAVSRIVCYQTLNLSNSQGGHRQLEHWASRQTPQGSGLAWWEVAASTGSSLGLFALIAAASRPELSPSEAEAIASAYWPWIGALHSLLDSLVDRDEDNAAGRPSLLDYTDHDECVDRLDGLTTTAKRAALALPQPREHLLILAAMTSYYLTSPNAATPTAALIAERVHRTLPISKTTNLVMRARHRRARRQTSDL